jgi:hypothetical protein
MRDEQGMIVSTRRSWSLHVARVLDCRTEMELFRPVRSIMQGSGAELIAKAVDFTYTGNHPRRISKVKKNFMAGVPLGT